MKGIGPIGNVIKTYYDKVIAILAFTALVVSVVFVGVRMATMDSMQNAYSKKISKISVPHPNAANVEVSSYEAAETDLNSPQLIPAYSNNLFAFAPEERVWCTECRFPISFRLDTCSYCGTHQPTNSLPPPEDFDDDGISDAWELEYGLNPKDPSDALEDPDGDFFTNLDEFNAREAIGRSTDPGDKSDYPPIAVKMCIADIKTKPFKLLFKSYSRSGPGGKLVYFLNSRTEAQTYYKKLGDYVGDYRIIKFKQILKPVVKNGIPREIDLSVLTLSRGKETIILTKGNELAHVEHTITVRFREDSSEYEISKPGDIFEVLGRKYVVKSIDTELRKIVIRGANGKDMEIQGECRE